MKTAIRTDQRIGLLLAGVVLLTLLGIGATVALPATDESLHTDAELSAEEQKGLEIYRDKGLWQCETAYSRETSVEPAPATTAEQVANSSPAMLGLEQIGDCGVELSDDESAAVNAFIASRGVSE